MFNIAIKGYRRSDMKNKKGSYSFYRALSLASNGFLFAVYKEKHLKFHLFIGFFVIVFALLNALSVFQWIALSFAISGVIVAELFNTAIEMTVDLFTKKKRFRAKLAKDIAASAVLVASINAVIIAYLVFFPLSDYRFSFSNLIWNIIDYI
jgi:diacylglycerol kinase (ATP)